MSKVVKFGGSSLASAEQFKKVGNIIRADKERKYVVPSAPGKRFSNDTKVTDMLYACYDLADQGKSFKAELDAIKARYQEIIDGLQLDLDLSEEFKTIEKNFKAKSVCSFVVDADPFGITVIYYIHYIALGKKSQNSGLLIRLGSHTKSLRVDLCDHSAHIIGQCLRIIPEQEIFVFGPADQRTGLDLGPTVPAL